MNRNEYRRALIMLRSLLNGYSGHARIEIRTLTGNLSILASTPPNAQSVRAALVGKRRSEYFAYPLGNLRRDMRGQAGLTVTFDPRDVGGRTLDAYSLLALVTINNGECELALVGNLNGACEMDWSRVRDAVCALYAPQPRGDAPETEKSAAVEAETVGEAAETPEPEANDDPDAREGASCPIESRKTQAENAAEQSERHVVGYAQDESADENSDKGLVWDFAPETDETYETGASGTAERKKAAETDAEQHAEAREDSSEPFRREGWTFVRVALPAACGYPYAYVGMPGCGREVCVALPAQFTAEPPAGLEEYDWSGGAGRGWWVRCYPVKSAEDK